VLRRAVRDDCWFGRRRVIARAFGPKALVPADSECEATDVAAPINPRPGFGARHPEVTVFLAGSRRLSSSVGSWPNGDGFRLATYALGAPVPEIVVSSVRCIVLVGDEVVVCTNEHGRHPWPGGRRNPGESFVDTARREVLEETGWVLDESSLELLGWLHIELDAAMPPNHPYPHPDLFQAVYVGRAGQRAGDNTWTDVEGYEVSSELMSIEAAKSLPMSLTDAPAAPVFLDMVAARLL
jgi:8-oxo-dGTP pyrophosphatase MutT (NUDIX family)